MNQITFRTAQPSSRKYGELCYEDLECVFRQRFAPCSQVHEPQDSDVFDIGILDMEDLSSVLDTMSDPPAMTSVLLPYHTMFFEYAKTGPSHISYNETFVKNVTAIANNVSGAIYKCFETYKTTLATEIKYVVDAIIDFTIEFEGTNYKFTHTSGCVRVHANEKSDALQIQYVNTIDTIIKIILFLIDPVRYAASGCEVVEFATFNELAGLSDTVLLLYDNLVKSIN